MSHCICLAAFLFCFFLLLDPIPEWIVPAVLFSLQCFSVESILAGIAGTWVSSCKAGSWSPLRESLAVKLILLSHTPVCVPSPLSLTLGLRRVPPEHLVTVPSLHWLWRSSRLATPRETELDKSKGRGASELGEQAGEVVAGVQYTCIQRRTRPVGAQQSISRLLVNGSLPCSNHLVSLETQRELMLPFASSAPGYVRKSPTVLSHVLGQNPIRLAFPQGPCTVVPQGRAGYVKASSPPLISVLQGCWSWLCVRYTGHCLNVAAFKILNVGLPVDPTIKPQTRWHF